MSSSQATVASTLKLRQSEALTTEAQPEPQKPLTLEEIEVALLELTLESAWCQRLASIARASTRRQRRACIELEMDTVLIALHGARSRAARKLCHDRVLLLQYGMTLFDIEERSRS